MVDVDQEVRQVVAESFLGKLPHELTDQLLGGAELADYPAGAVLYRGEPLPRPRLVIRGLLRVYIESREGRQVTILYARRGEFLGTPVVPLRSINVSVQVLKTARVLGVDLSSLREVVRMDVRAAYATVEDLAWRLQEQLEQTRINAFGNVKQRIAWQLLDLCREPRDGAPLTVHLSQQQLADAVGSVREVVARILGELRQAEIVSTGPGRITIIDPERLHRECWAAASVTSVTRARHQGH